MRREASCGGENREARGLTPAALDVSPPGLAIVAMLTQRLRAGLSYAAASRLAPVPEGLRL